MVVRGGAEGCIGLLVDVGPETEVLAVGPGDLGSFTDPVAGEPYSDGKPPTLEACEESIRLRQPSNEWRVRGYVPIGIFVLSPLYARKASDLNGTPVYADAEIHPNEVFTAFHHMRVFSANDTEFKEYDRSARRWHNVAYDAIIPPL